MFEAVCGSAVRTLRTCRRLDPARPRSFPWLALGWDRDFTPPMTGQDGPRIVMRGEGKELVLQQQMRLVRRTGRGWSWVLSYGVCRESHDV